MWRRLTPYLFIAASLLAIIASTDPGRHFTPDSWTLFELARSVFTDFYHVETIREYAFASEYSASFPPLWPVIVAVFTKLFVTETGAGLIANAMLAMTTLWLLVQLSGRLYGREWLGFLLFLVLLANRHYIYSFRGVHSMVLYLALFAGLYWVLLKKPAITWKEAAFSGLLAGLLGLTRFDGIAYGIALLPVVVWFSNDRAKSAGAYIAAFILTLLPWMLYCHAHFGTWLASDNSRTLWAVDHVFVLDYLPQGVPTIRDDFGKWFGNAWREGEAFLGIAFTKLLFVPSLLCLLWYAAKKSGAKFAFRKPKLRNKHYALFFPLIAQMGLVAVSGYHEARYLLPVQLALLLYLAGLVDWKKFKPGQWLEGHGVKIFFSLCIIIVVVYLAGTALNKDRQFFGAFRTQHAPSSYDMLIECLKDRPEGAILMAGDRLSYRFGAFHRGKVYLEPYGVADWPAYFEEFGIRYVLLPQDQTAPVENVRKTTLCTLPEWGKIKGGLALYEILAYKATP